MKRRRLRVSMPSTLLWALLLGSPCGLVWADEGAEGALPAIEIHLQKSRLYLREFAPLGVTLLTEPGTTVRNIRFPRLAEGGAFRVAEFSPPRQRTVVRDGQELLAYEFKSTLDPIRAGDVELGPVELICDLPGPPAASGAFFSGGEPRATTLRSRPIRLSVLPLPTRGRPVDFSGAVGHFSVTRQVVPATIRAGDPIAVTTRIEGVGNIDSYSCQSITLPDVRGYPVTEKRSANRLTCEQILLPTSALAIPGAAISFFDPRRGRYQTRRVNPLRVDVLAEPSAVPLPAPATVTQPVDAREFGRGGLIGAAVVATLGAALLGLALLGRRRAAERARANFAAPSPTAANWLAEAERALAASDAQRFYLAAFRIAQHLAARTGRPAADIVGRCDAVRFGRGQPDQDDMQAIFGQLRESLRR